VLALFRTKPVITLHMQPKIHKLTAKNQDKMRQRITSVNFSSNISAQALPLPVSCTSPVFIGAATFLLVTESAMAADANDTSAAVMNIRL
jgi:hypothetical protein